MARTPFCSYQHLLLLAEHLAPSLVSSSWPISIFGYVNKVYVYHIKLGGISGVKGGKETTSGASLFCGLLGKEYDIYISYW